MGPSKDDPASKGVPLGELAAGGGDDGTGEMDPTAGSPQGAVIGPLLTITTPGLTIGQGEGALSYQRNLISTGWTENVIGTVSVSGWTVTVSFGGSSDSFTLSGGVYTNAEELGSTLTIPATSLGLTSVSSGPGNGAALTTSSQTYDVFGNVATTVGPLGSTQTVAYFWDADRQLTGVIGPEPAGSSTYPALRYTFSANGQQTLVEPSTTSCGPDATIRPPRRVITGSTLLTYCENLDGSVMVSYTIRYAATATSGC